MDSKDKQLEDLKALVATCTKQQRIVFAFLKRSITAKLTGTTAPSLLS